MIEDSEILELYNKDSKDEAFNHIVRKYSERLYWHIRELCGSHDDAYDLLQTTFIKVWNALPTFRNDCKLYTWIWRIATNETLTFLRRKKIISFLSLQNYSTYLQEKMEDEPYFDGDKLQLLLNKAIITLPPRQRAVFSLRYFQEMKYDEISEIMGISVGALKASYHHAYNKIKTILQDEWDN